jgi:hypothetical protein
MFFILLSHFLLIYILRDSETYGTLFVLKDPPKNVSRGRHTRARPPDDPIFPGYPMLYCQTALAKPDRSPETATTLPNYYHDIIRLPLFQSHCV